MKAKLLHAFLFVCFGFPVMLWGQSTITGIVLDSSNNNEPMIGVTVQEKETDQGTITDIDGKFTIVVTGADPVLIFRYTGYKTTEVIVGGRSQLEVILAEESQIFEELVVVGYGVQKKSDLTGAVSSVKAKDINRIPSANVEQTLQGKMAGVYVSPSSGQPGAGAVIRIRGTGTLNNANPLYVIDGMITYDASIVNPADVQSVEVLKDASAAAIYGSRGANGVILITTKSGVFRDRSLISASAYYGSQEVIREIDVLNAAEFARAYNDLRGGQPFYTNPDSLGEGTNWQREIFRMAPMYNAHLGVNGGSEKFTFNFSSSYFSQDGIIKNSHFDKLTLRLNAEYKVNKWLSLGHNLAYYSIRDEITPSVVTSAYRMPPVFAPRDASGDFTDPTFFGLALANPAADLFYKSNHRFNGSKTFGTLFADILFLKNFKFRSSLGFDKFNVREKRFEPQFEVSASQRNLNDRLSVGAIYGNEWIWEQTLTYDRTWNEHHITALAGFTTEERRFEGLGASRENFPGTADDLLYLSAGNDTTQMNSSEQGDEAMISNLFRVNYTFMDRYLFTATWRTDRSSRFTKANRTGHFPSASVGWNIGAEPFMSDVPWISRLKVRASYGVLGNQNSSTAYPSTGAVTSGLYGIFGTSEALNQGATLISLANSNLQWETSNQTDLGLETSLFDGKFEFEIDWYRRHTYDIIAAVPIPDYVGSQNDPVVNTAEVENKGLDIALLWRETRGKVSYNLGVFLSPVNNKVLKLAEGRSEIFAAILNGEPATRTVVGRPIGAFYGYIVQGIFQTQEEIDASANFGIEKPGDIRYADLNGDGTLNGDDRTYLGSPIPTFSWGLTAGVDLFGFDLTADLVGASGHKVFNAKETFRFGVYNWEGHVVDRWTLENPSLTEPRISNGGHNFRVSDQFIANGSFVRLSSVTLGYSLPASLLSKAKMLGLRVFLTGSNIWSDQDYRGYSTEFANESNSYEVGFDFGGYPFSKSWIGGINIQF